MNNFILLISFKNGFSFAILFNIFPSFLPFFFNFLGFVLSILSTNFLKGFLHMTSLIVLIATKYALIGAFWPFPNLHLLKAFNISCLSFLFNIMLSIFNPYENWVFISLYPYILFLHLNKYLYNRIFSFFVLFGIAFNNRVLLLL